MTQENKISVKSYIASGILWTSAILLTRRHIQQSFIYRRKYEKWAYYFHSYEKLIWNEKNCLIFKNLSKKPHLIYPTAIFTYEVLSYLLDYSFKEFFSNYIPGKSEFSFSYLKETTSPWVKTGIKSVLFCNIFVSRSLINNLGTILIGEILSGYETWVEHYLMTYF